MLLIKHTCAEEVLAELVDQDGIAGDDSSPLTRLYDAILEANKWDALDHLVSDEFPNGADEDELEEFFRDEYDSIVDQLGLSVPDDDGYEDGDEDEENDED